jgi:hypothetical protein
MAWPRTPVVREVVVLGTTVHLHNPASGGDVDRALVAVSSPGIDIGLMHDGSS